MTERISVAMLARLLELPIAAHPGAGETDAGCLAVASNDDTQMPDPGDER